MVWAAYEFKKKWSVEYSFNNIYIQDYITEVYIVVASYESLSLIALLSFIQF